MKRMLINATQPEELRVAIVDGQKLFNLDIETPAREQKKANIYKGKITRIEPSLEAAFVDYGSERHGFLPMKEIARTYFSEAAQQQSGRVNIKDALKEGQEIVVQIEKEERGNKGAALTTFVSLAGRYLVLMPSNPRAGGVSRRIEGQDRTDLREAMSQLNIPEDMGLIVRTAGVGKNAEELQWDLDYLTQLWSAIETSANEKPASFLIYQESDVIIRSIRDYLRADIGEIVIDDPGMFEKAQQFVQQVMPHNLKKLRPYQEEVPLFTRYQIESQIETAFAREVQLPSGGAIVIDPTEALTSIDINSARATKGSDIEETALNTNLEAADEIARQLRLRDLGGLFVIDFIDMTPTRNQREVETRLKEALKQDRARVQVGRISRFGLLEMSRQRLRPSLGEASLQICPRCAGQGSIRGAESLSLSILRIVEEGAMKDGTSRIVAQLPVEVATFLLNEKRQSIVDIEKRHAVEILLVPNPHMERPNYNIERIRVQDVDKDQETGASYELVERPDNALDVQLGERIRGEEPTVKQISPTTPVPSPSRPPPEQENILVQPPKGLLKRMFNSLFSGHQEVEVTPPTQPAATSQETTAKTDLDRGESRERQPSRRGQGRSQQDQRKRSPAGGRGRSSGQRNRPEKQEERGGKAVSTEQPKPVAPEETPQSSTQAESGKNVESTGRRSGSRRGRRGGTRRSGRRTGSAQAQAEQNNDGGTRQANKNDDSPNNAGQPQNKQGQAPATETTVSEQKAKPSRRRRGSRKPRSEGNSDSGQQNTADAPTQATNTIPEAEVKPSRPVESAASAAQANPGGDSPGKTAVSTPVANVNGDSRVKTATSVPVEKTGGDSQVKTATPAPAAKTGGDSQVKTATPAPVIKPGGDSQVKAATPAPVVKTGSDSQVKAATPAPVVKTGSDTQVKTVTPAPVANAVSDSPVKTAPASAQDKPQVPAHTPNQAPPEVRQGKTTGWTYHESEQTGATKPKQENPGQASPAPELDKPPTD